jgi:hypothetical protein
LRLVRQEFRDEFERRSLDYLFLVMPLALEAKFHRTGLQEGPRDPSVHELYQFTKGTMPSGQLWELYKSILLVNGTMCRKLSLPPGAPKDEVDTLRQAVVSLASDKRYSTMSRIRHSMATSARR